ncbi:MAG: fatty acid desaturase family protein [Polyangiaceae bacterium]
MAAAVRLKDPKELDGYTRWNRAADVASIATFVGLGIVIERRLILANPMHLLSVPAAMLTGLLLADLASGLVHWGCDTWGSTEIPIVGRHFIRPFREHHVDPKSITRHDLVETNGNNCFSALPVEIVALFLNPTSAFQAYVATSLVFLALFVGFTGQIHKYAHMEDGEPPAFVRWLQDKRIILSRRHHDHHHGAPFDRHYCITVGFWDRPLERIGFFRRFERLITRVTGVLPRTDDIGEVAAAELVAAPSVIPPALDSEPSAKAATQDETLCRVAPPV